MNRFARLRASLLLGLLLLASALLPATTLVRIRVEHANAREEPDSSSQIRAVLNHNEVREVLGDVPYWYRIRLANGQPAYVAKSLCEVVSPEDGDVTEGDTEPDTGLFAIPAVGTMVPLAGCTTSTQPADFSICPVGGTPGGQNTATNIMKNRLEKRCSFESFTVDRMLGLRNLPGTVRTLPLTAPERAYLDNLEGRAVVLEGFLALVKNGGEESVNCGSSTRKDIHLEIVGSGTEDPRENRPTHLVAEVTPWFKPSFPTWTVAGLSPFSSYRNSYSFKTQPKMARLPVAIRVYGWMFFDVPHSADGSIGKWRGSGWEVHPIVRIEVLSGGAWTNIE